MTRRRGVMLAYPFSEERLNNWLKGGLPVLVQPKINGVRCRAVLMPHGYELLSSEENVIQSVPHINSALNELEVRSEFDGELYIHRAPLPEITSITSRTVNIHLNHSKVLYFIFDTISDKSQIKRLDPLHELSRWMVNKKNGVIWPIRVVPTLIAFNIHDVAGRFQDITSEGYEGIILRHPTAPYIPKKTTAMMKMKPRKEGTYLIVNQHEEYSIHGEPKNRLGAFVCQTKEGKTFKVGTGLTTKQREEYWERSLEGKMLRIKYQELTPRRVPFFPVFVEILNDADD